MLVLMAFPCLQVSSWFVGLSGLGEGGGQDHSINIGGPGTSLKVSVGNGH